MEIKVSRNGDSGYRGTEIQSIEEWRFRVSRNGDSGYRGMEIQVIEEWRFSVSRNGDSGYCGMENTMFPKYIHTGRHERVYLNSSDRTSH